MYTTPRLKFRLNKKLDKDMCLHFLGVKAGGIDFGRGLVTLHPKLRRIGTLNQEGKINAISDYVDRYYRRNERVLASFMQTFRLEWRSIGEQFYRAVNRVFPRHPWPEGLYICYISIFNSNPRFLENKTFQIYYRHPYGVKYMVAHEMLHFIFYDYVEKKFTKEIERVPSQKLWVLSEVFNNIILSLPEFVTLTGKASVPYPDHVESTKKLMKIWNSYNDIDMFLKHCLSREITMERGDDKPHDLHTERLKSG